MGGFLGNSFTRMIAAELPAQYKLEELVDEIVGDLPFFPNSAPFGAKFKSTSNNTPVTNRLFI